MNHQYLKIFISGCIVIAASIYSAVLWIPASVGRRIFYLTISPIVFAELLIVVSFLYLLKRRDGKSSIWRLFYLTVSVGYFIFSLIMIYPAICLLRWKSLMTFQIWGIVLLAVLVILGHLCEVSAYRQDSAQIQYESVKKNLMMIWSAIHSTLSIQYPCDTVIKREIDALSDEIALYSPSESEEKHISEENFSRIKSAIANGRIEAIIEELRRFRIVLRTRRDLLQNIQDED